ncbi:DUF551 domain-containing protein [Acinetobacter baumannii]|uniref:DUF551 domain-containing protein n=1 Tax=Acinetobacter baumannii TaxID=470 RepID=UPI00044588FC|nr:DUF551 domain-containing protein [Acinetobacter baumannii]EXA86682.1 hypothetical protein J517_1925 [Acinetobacter baumannii 118362]EXH50674.1 hypothetical protein J605_0736 [Acinetobacter baumannii 1412924]
MDIELERKAFEEAIVETEAYEVMSEFCLGPLDRDENGKYEFNPTNLAFESWLERSKTNVWHSAKDQEPPLDTTVLICWEDAPEVEPEMDYMTCDEDLNHYWANFEKDAPSHWMPLPEPPKN